MFKTKIKAKELQRHDSDEYQMEQLLNQANDTEPIPFNVNWHYDYAEIKKLYLAGADIEKYL